MYQPTRFQKLTKAPLKRKLQLPTMLVSGITRFQGFFVNSSIRIPPPDLIGQVFLAMFPPGGLYSREVNTPSSEIIGFPMLLTF